ncbi:ArnT family glycosyltransferase [Patescibacteria group bacterium]
MGTNKKTQTFKTFIDFLHKHEWLVVLLFVVFVLRVPSLHEPHWYGDEEIYLVMGQGLRKGLVFYRDIFDHKTPLIYVVAALVRNVFWFRMLLMVVHAVSVVLFAKLADLLFKKRSSVITSTVLYSILSTLPMLEGNIANGENFMTVPALGGMLLVYQLAKKGKKASSVQFFVVGLLFSLGFLIKVPIVFDFFAAGYFWWLISQKKLTIKATFSRLLSKELWFTILGFLAPILLSVVYYYAKGAIEPYVRSALLQNIGYIESWEGKQSSPFANPLVWRMLLIAGFGLIFLVLKKHKKSSNRVLFLSMWLLLSLYGSLLSNRPYPHYLLQPLIPAVFLFGLMFDVFASKKNYRDLAVGSGIFGIVIVLLIEIGFWHYPTIPYYKNFVEYVSGKKDRQAYENYFPSSLERNKKIASYLRKRTLPDERVFVWGEEPAIYDLSDRLPVGRYIVSFHIRDFPNGYDETYKAVATEKPRFIVVIPGQPPHFPELEALIQNNYIKVKTIDGVDVHMILESELARW